MYLGLGVGVGWGGEGDDLGEGGWVGCVVVGVMGWCLDGEAVG